MRKYEHSPEGDPGPPTITVSESCDTTGCQRRYVLPDGDTTIVNGGLPPMPRIPHMDAYLREQGWKHDYLMSQWHCPSEGPVYALLPTEDAVEADRESVLATQEWEPVPPAEDPEEEESDDEPKPHWLTRWDRDGDPYGVVCGCPLGIDHDGDGDPFPAIAWIDPDPETTRPDTEQEDETDA